MNRILRNAIQTPDGTILASRTRHDYKEYMDADGGWHMIDGGLDYIRRSTTPAIDLSVSEGDAPHEKLRELVTWGTYGKKGDQPLSYRTIATMDTEHLQAVVDTQILYPQIKDLMQAELEYRDEQNQEEREAI